MNKTLKLALGAVLSMGFIASAIAQDQFPDVPENHWAYEALANMKKNGLLVGYPDGLFRGGRPATRYEMAVAIHATYQYLKNITDGLQTQIDELKGKGGSAYDDSAIKAALAALQNDVNAMKGWGDDIANLKKMAATFEKELASLGVDVEAMKKDLKDLNDRVTKLEKNALPITVHGDVNFFASHGKGTSGRFGLGTDGSLVGVTTGGVDRAAGVGDGLSVFHEANLKIAGVNEEGPKWHAILEIGNILNGWGSAPGRTGFATARNDTAGTEISFRELVAEFDSSMVGQNFNAKVGRFGVKISPYLYQSPDTNPYYTSEFDNGEWTMDGALLGFGFGSANLRVFFGRTQGRSTNQGTDLSGVTAGNIDAIGTTGAGALGGLKPGYLRADSTFGAHLNVPIGENGAVDLAYLIMSQNTPSRNPAGNPGSPSADNVHTFGGDLHYKINDAIDFEGGYAQTNMYLGKKSVVTRDNFAWHLMAKYEAERWGIGAGYREIQPNFGAAGDWGRLGTWWNPTDLKGFNVNAHFDLTDALSLNGSGEWMSGLGKNNYRSFNGGPLINGSRTDDRIDSYKINLNYKMESGWDWMVGAEFVDFRFAGVVGRPTQRWYTVGVGYNLSENAMFKLMWQVSDADAKNTGAWGAGNNRFSGNLITTQLTIKF